MAWNIIWILYSSLLTGRNASDLDSQFYGPRRVTETLGKFT